MYYAKTSYMASWNLFLLMAFYLGMATIVLLLD